MKWTRRKQEQHALIDVIDTVRSGRRLLPLVIAVVLQGCAVGPDYRAPESTLPAEWATQPAGARADGNDESSELAAWWRSLNDPTLDELIDRAIIENTGVRQAVARVVEARARRNITIGGFFPNIGASASGSRVDSEPQTGTTLDPSVDSGVSQLGGGVRESFSAGLDAQWELDIFGGQRRSLEASNAQLAATDADLRDVLVTLLGDVALAYVNVRTTQSRLDFAERNLEAQRELVDITRWRNEAGLATVLDVEQARSSYAQTQAQIPSLEASLATARHRLSVLTGQAPGALNGVLAQRRPIPVAPDDFVSSVPAEVLRRRPDVRAAERRLAAQTAQVGVATAALYPSLSLSGTIGLASGVAGDLFSDGVKSDRIGASLSMPIFRAGALRQNIKAQNALVDSALAAYDTTLLAVYEEVENALTAWGSERQRHVALETAAESARLASELARMQYNSGLVDFQTVLTADRTLIGTEDSLAVSDGELTSNLIRLYKAFGGGWAVFPQATAASR